MIVRVWFSKSRGSTERPWLVQRDDGRVMASARVALRATTTLYDPEGFADLPDTPKGVIEGELVADWDSVPVT